MQDHIRDALLMGLMFLPGTLGFLYAAHRAHRGQRAYDRAVEGTGVEDYGND